MTIMGASALPGEIFIRIFVPGKTKNQKQDKSKN